MREKIKILIHINLPRNCLNHQPAPGGGKKMSFWKSFLDIRQFDWGNLLLDTVVFVFFLKFYGLIENFIVPRLTQMYWFTEPLQLYLFAIMVAYTIWRQPAKNMVNVTSAGDYLPKPGLAFAGIGGVWILFYSFVIKANETVAVILFLFLHLIFAAYAALGGAKLANKWIASRIHPAIIHISVQVQIIIGLLILEIIFAAIIQYSSEQNHSKAYGFVISLWGLACFLPFRLFLMLQPPFHPIEVVTATGSYISLVKAALE